MKTHIHFSTLLAYFIGLGMLLSCTGTSSDSSEKNELAVARPTTEKKTKPGVPVITQQFFGCKAHR